MSIMRCERHDHSWDSDLLSKCPKCESESPISQAIIDRNLLSFNFQRLLYTVEPHAYGETSSGDEVLRCFQVGGDDQQFGWKLIPVAEVTNLDVLEQHFPSARSGYALGDRGMAKIYAQLEQPAERKDS